MKIGELAAYTRKSGGIVNAVNSLRDALNFLVASAEYDAAAKVRDIVQQLESEDADEPSGWRVISEPIVKPSEPPHA